MGGQIQQRFSIHDFAILHHLFQVLNPLFMYTFSKIHPHLFPEWNIAVEDDALPIHSNTLKALFAAKSGSVVGTL